MNIFRLFVPCRCFIWFVYICYSEMVEIRSPQI